MPRTTQSALAELRRTHAGKKIVFCSGVFDLTHPGHVLFFEDCRRHGDILVVGVGSDAVIKRDKGPLRPILNETMRLKMLESLRAIDYAFVIDSRDESETLDELKPVFESLQPDVYVMNDDARNIEHRRAMLSHLPVKIVILGRTCPPEYEGVSTSKIIEKIQAIK